MSGFNKRYRLFQEGADSLLRLFGVANVYVCPICLNVFDTSSISSDGPLSLEHVPPESVGGKEIVLTCKRCNNDAGASIDAAIDKRAQFNQFASALAGKATFRGRVRLTMGRVTTNIDAEIADKKVNMVVPRKINNPKKRRDLFCHMDYVYKNDKWDGEKFQIQPLVFVNFRKALVGDLKTAYLAAFASLGYRYIWHNSLNPVREQLANPERQVIGIFSCRVPSGLGSGLRMRSIEKPFSAIAVQLERSIIFLPAPYDNTRFYEQLPNFLALTKQSERISGSEWEWPTWSHFQLDKA